MYLDNTSYVSIDEKPTNKYYESDMKYAVKYSRLFLRVLGVWPLMLKDTTTTQKKCSVFLIIICAISLLFAIIPPCIDLIIRTNDPTNGMAIITVIIYFTSSLLRLGVFALRYKTLMLCMEHMKIDWMTIESDHNRMIMLRSVRHGHNLTVNCCVATSMAYLVFLVIKPIWLGKIVNEYNITIRMVAIPGSDIIFDLQSSRTYGILFCANCFSGIVSYSTINASCSFTAAFVSHACGQIQVIVWKLETLIGSIDEDENCDDIQSRLSLITQQHVKVLRLSSKIEEAVRELCVVEVIAATLLICTIEYYLVMVKKNLKKSDGHFLYIVFRDYKYSSLQARVKDNPSVMLSSLCGFVSSCLNILLFCYIGELLKEQGHQVGKAASMVEWYRLSPKTAHDLMMIIIMDNYPPNITAGRIFELSIANFGAIIRTSLTYSNMLRAIT